MTRASRALMDDMLELDPGNISDGGVRLFQNEVRALREEVRSLRDTLARIDAERALADFVREDPPA